MKIRILGAGWYGCHIASSLLPWEPAYGVTIEVHESADHIFAGASGSNPARLHQGQHYPRSAATRLHCRQHNSRFLERYGHLTNGIQTNIYAIAEKDSLVDFGTYVKILDDEVPFINIFDPEEYGLQNVEGAIITNERHIVISKAKAHFERVLGDRIKLNVERQELHSKDWDITIDCTFCSNEGAGIDRYEPCLTALLIGPCDKAVTIMDGPFPSLYPWEEEENLLSLTSAKLTPFDRVKTWKEAKSILDEVTGDEDRLFHRTNLMIEQMAFYYPAIKKQYMPVDHRLGIRAMPHSAADSRLVEVLRLEEGVYRVRAGKIDAIFHAEDRLREFIGLER